ncbi:hypothetical protein JGH11_12000 [Dysgonomonas sp. Marseille-P4677]|uniref:hypothetical protein n=1 Tax=Dysgonomonas sp. Marseille-P4677 TaxID=2364790 RepID=UPI001912FD22|nr:hypothetical protein [Dysgonomonas sp. Marseille-P4677]MBK5721594.1 hypothetical protein [Dysgonomonas sp. Marseille-P4677]
MLKLKKISLFVLLCCLSFSLYAQKSTVRATIQPSDILIGEQAIINVEVIAPKDRNIIFPAYQDTLITGIEVLKMLKPDTVMTEVMTISQKYVVTSFDSTLYHVPYMQVIDGIDTLRTNDFGLKVSAPQLSEQSLAYLEQLKNHETDSIDFEKLQISDIKTVQKPPFVWQDYLEYLYIPLLIFLVLALIGLGVYFFLRKRKKGYYFTPKIVLPPHVIALQELDKLKTSKLWQKGQEKEYYTELTDILREYIDGRFKIDAPEMISDDIIDAVHLATDTKSATDGLSQILKLADLVKFAKYTPFADENDLSLVNAYLFVNQTKIEERPTEEQKNAIIESVKVEAENNVKNKKQS